MVNFSLASLTNTTNITRRDRYVPSMADSIIIIIINIITMPCTVILNVLVIKAVKTTPRLRTNNNILLACLAVTDALTGLLGQPLFILWRIFLIFDLSSSKTVGISFISFLLVTLVSSYFHLMLVTFERLIAIKFTMQYSNIITEKNMKIAVIVARIIGSIYGVLGGTEEVRSGQARATRHFMYPLSYFRLPRHVSRNCPPQREDRNSTTAPRSCGKISLRKKST